MSRVVALITDECLADADLGLPESEEARAAAVKEVGTDIKRFVGQAFGAWKKGKT
jgi:hypothetical protein